VHFAAPWCTLFLIAKSFQGFLLLHGHGEGRRVTYLGSKVKTTVYHQSQQIKIVVAAPSLMQLRDFYFSLILQGTVQAFLVVLMNNLLLMIKQPIDAWLVVHCFMNCLSCCFAMNFEQRFMIKVFIGGRSRIQPNRTDDPQVDLLSLWGYHPREQRPTLHWRSLLGRFPSEYWYRRCS